MPGAFIPDPDFEREWLQSDEAVAMLEELGPELVDGAYQRARKRSENMADSIAYEVGIVDGVATGRLRADDFKAGWWEFGNAVTGRDPFLTPTVEDLVGPVRGGRS